MKNTGTVPGKEVAQVYWSKMDQEGSEHPMQALGGFEKTSLLAPGEEEVLSITIPWKELAVYEEERAAWVLEKGSMHCVWKLFQKYGLVENLCKQNRIMS
ncbi:MAG: fibronectin type III-like domain-contianing protein [Blautia faecis]